ncbi:hypothetical protein OJ998_10305 [Solirubrobacter taibaiensis]|nr:hypothetical protein [Solirubrobacter taibaiensis]
MSFQVPLLGSAAMITTALALSTVGSPAQQRPGIEVHRDTRSELASVNLAEAVTVAQAQAAGPDGLPALWCGDETTTEGTANASSPESAAHFKVVYAYVADRPNRFAGFQDALQANVAITERFLSAQSGGTKAIRFDMGTRCGPEYVDLQVVALPGPRSDYADNFNAIATAVSRALGPSAGPRNTVILADSLSSMGVEFGLGETIMGDAGEQPGAANPHNRGGLRSVLFTRDGDAVPGTARGGWWPEGFLHEVTHNLGGVQWGAPHSTAPATSDQRSRYGHCWQGADVMCYVEDEGAAHAMQYDCAPIAGTIAQSFDCGRDDYYNPAPAAGSYLATHWNTYDSTFMVACAGIAPACGGGESWVPAPPVATKAPSISGRARRGAPLQTHDGTWLNAPDTYIRTWQRETPKRRWVNVSSGSAPSYAPSQRDLGRRLRVVVIAENADGVTASTSAPTAPIASIGIARAAANRKHKGPR